MKNRIRIVVVIEVLFFLAAVAGVLIINTVYYRNTYIPHHTEQLDEIKASFSENRRYFNLAVDGFKDKYAMFDSIDSSEDQRKENTISGELTCNTNGILLTLDGGGVNYIHTDNNNPSDCFSFTQEQADALNFILRELKFSTIVYTLSEDGNCCLYFCKDGILKKPRFSLLSKDIYSDAQSFGIVYYSDEHTGIEQMYISESLSAADWYIAYSQ